MTRRSRGREVALQVLYLREQNAHVDAPEIDQFVGRRIVDPKTQAFAHTLINGVRLHQDALDVLISGFAENWRLDRMAAIDRNILRLGAYEMLHSTDVPPKVAINEALELAKRYSTAQSSRFVNGILDRLLVASTTPADKVEASGSEAESDATPGEDSPNATEPSPPADPEPGPPE